MAADGRVRLRPVIDEIVRTQVCPDTATLLVDHISVIRTGRSNTRAGGGSEAFRLWLSDGCKSIQAIVKYELHPYLAAGHICEGSYVEVTKYELAPAKRLNGNGFVYILQIADFNAVGHDGRASQPFLFEDVQPSQSSPAKTPTRKEAGPVKPCTPDLDLDSPGSLARFFASQKSLRDDKSIHEDAPPEDEVALVPPPRLRVQDKPKDAEPENESPSPQKRKREISSSPLEAISDNQSERPVKVAKCKATMPAIEEAEPPSTLKEVSRPLKITPLSKIVGPRTVRNKIHDVLAVVCSVEDQVIRRHGMPEQRNIRITDQSTTRHVQLTVFVDAVAFKPEVGTVALFRNVCTHEWNGGSLKAYQRDCAKVRWYLPRPDCVDPKMLSLLQHCWESRRAIQQEESTRSAIPSKPA